MHGRGVAITETITKAVQDFAALCLTSSWPLQVRDPSTASESWFVIAPLLLLLLLSSAGTPHLAVTIFKLNLM